MMFGVYIRGGMLPAVHIHLEFGVFGSGGLWWTPLFQNNANAHEKTMCLALFCLKWGKGFAKNGRENIKEVVKRRFQWNVSQHKNENALIYCNCIYIYTLKILNTQTEWNTIVYSVYCSNLKVKQNHTMSQLWDLTGQVHHKHAKQICLKVKCMCQSLWHAMLYVTEIMKAAIYHDATSVIISIVHCPRAKQWCPLRTHADLCQI